MKLAAAVKLTKVIYEPNTLLGNQSYLYNYTM